MTLGWVLVVAGVYAYGDHVYAYGGCVYAYGRCMHVYAYGIMSSVSLCACDSVNW